MRAVNKSRDFTRFRYALSASDSLLVQSHEDTETSIGPYDTGFLISRNGKTIESESLSNLPDLLREEPEYSESFTTLAVTHGCNNAGPVFFVTMQYMGDMTSPALIFILVPSAVGYDVSTLPMISGGVVDVSIANPLHVRTWDNLHEGECEACETRYQITESEIRHAKPVQTRQYRTKRLYTSGDFDNRRRIRFIP